MAKKDLVRLLVRLYGEPRLREKIVKQPHKTADFTRLTQGERDLLVEGDEKKIGAYLGDDLAGMIEIVTAAKLEIVTVADPGKPRAPRPPKPGKPRRTPAARKTPKRPKRR